MNAETKHGGPVDVLAVPPHSSIEVTDWTCLQSLAFAVNALREHHYRPDIVRKVGESVAAVAELIEADKGYDTSVAALSDLHRRIAEHGWIEVEHDALRTAFAQVVRAQSRRQNALANVGGAK